VRTKSIFLYTERAFILQLQGFLKGTIHQRWNFFPYWKPELFIQYSKARFKSAK